MINYSLQALPVSFRHIYDLICDLRGRNTVFKLSLIVLNNYLYFDIFVLIVLLENMCTIRKYSNYLPIFVLFVLVFVGKKRTNTIRIRIR